MDYSKKKNRRSSCGFNMKLRSGARLSGATPPKDCSGVTNVGDHQMISMSIACYRLTSETTTTTRYCLHPYIHHVYSLSLRQKHMYFLWWMDLLEMWFHEISRVQRHTLQWQTLHTAYMHRIMGCQKNIARNTVFPKISSKALLSKLWSHEKSKRLRPRLWSPIAAHQSHGYARCHAVSLHKHSPWPWQALCRVPVLRKPSRKLNM